MWRSAFILCVLLVACCTAQKQGNTTLPPLIWTGGSVQSASCSTLCGNASLPFACSGNTQDISGGNWNGGHIQFQDPLGPDYVVQSATIQITANWNCGPDPITNDIIVYILFINSIAAVITDPMVPLQCDCPNCQYLTYVVQTMEYPFGWPGYTPGGMNNFSIIVADGGIVCINEFIVTLNFYAAEYGEWSILGLQPPVGLVGTNTTIHVTGAFFPTAAVFCVFGSVSVPAYGLSQTDLYCNTPPDFEAGTVPFQVYHAGNVARTNINFTFYDAPLVYDVQPNSGLTTESTTINIIGELFLNTSELCCRFVGAENTYPVRATYISPTNITCIAPPVMQAASESGQEVSYMNVTVQISFDEIYWFGNVTFHYMAPGKPVKHPISTVELLIWLSTGVALLAATGFIVAFSLWSYCQRRPYRPVPTDTEAARDLLSDVPQINPFEITLGERIGKGSFGEVYRGTWRGTEVAVKKLTIPVNMDEIFMKEFRNEINIMRRVRHPNVLQFLGASLVHPDLFIVTEYMPRGSLYRILHSTQPLDLTLLKFIALDAARGMCYLHNMKPPIIHRDLKSHNILLDQNWKAHVCDFGLSKIVVDASSAHYTACGTPCWTSPEVLKNQRYTTKADVYSFGIVLWEMVTRQDPFKGMPPFQIIMAVANQGLRPQTYFCQIPPDVPVNWLDLIQRCWHEDPDQRPTFELILQILESFP